MMPQVARLGHKRRRDANERGQHLAQHALHIVRHLAQARVPARVPCQGLTYNYVQQALHIACHLAHGMVEVPAVKARVSYAFGHHWHVW